MNKFIKVVLINCLFFFVMGLISCDRKKELLDNNIVKKRDTLCMVLEQDIKYLKVISMLDLQKKCQNKTNEKFNSYDYSWQIYVAALRIIGFTYMDDNYEKMIKKWVEIDYLKKHKWDTDILELPINGNFSMMKCIDFYHSNDLKYFTDSIKKDYRQTILNGELDSIFGENNELNDILYKQTKLSVP